jgi:hypothetical protein
MYDLRYGRTLKECRRSNIKGLKKNLKGLKKTKKQL